MQKLMVRLIATALGAGYSPKGPGTMGSLVALPLVWLIQEWPLQGQGLFWVTVFLLGLWACHQWQAFPGARTDDQRIVIDEVLGMAITLAGISHTPALGVGFVLFRVFDIAKPWPIRALDRWSKRKTGWLGAFGVIADDLAAGLAARLVLEAMLRAQVI